MCPFLTVGAVGEYDVYSEVIGGGHSGKRLPFQKENTEITMLWGFFGVHACFIVDPEMPAKLLCTSFPLSFHSSQPAVHVWVTCVRRVGSRRHGDSIWMEQVYWVTRDVCGKIVFEEFSVVSGSAITWENSESEFISFSPSRNVYAF